jgi:hypothetical protein
MADALTIELSRSHQGAAGVRPRGPVVGLRGRITTSDEEVRVQCASSIFGRTTPFTDTRRTGRVPRLKITVRV